VCFNEKAMENQILIKKWIDVVSSCNRSNRQQEILHMGLNPYSKASERSHDSLWNFECFSLRWLDTICASWEYLRFYIPNNFF